MGALVSVSVSYRRSVVPGMRAAGLLAEGSADVSATYEPHAGHIQPRIPGETLFVSSSTKPARVALPFIARAANVLATLANIASALIALVMIGRAGPLMALAWVLLAAGAFGVLAAQIGPAKDGRSVHDDEWEDEG